MELAQHALSASLVIVGRPIDQHVQIETLGGEPFPRTYATIRVERSLFGQAPQEIVVSYWGGEYQGRRIASSTTVTLELGVSKLFFLSREKQRGHELMGRGSGYEVEADGVSTGALRLSFADYVSVLEPLRRDRP
jgi:hypothetical protein